MLRTTPSTLVSNVAGKAFRCLIRDRADLAFGAGIVHRDIETAKPFDGLVDQGADVIVLAHVGIYELGFRTEGAQLLNKRLAGVIMPTGNDHLRPLVGEGHGGGAPDAGEPAGDQNDWVVHNLLLAMLLHPTAGGHGLTEQWHCS
jgi:hypothetical protein